MPDTAPTQPEGPQDPLEAIQETIRTLRELSIIPLSIEAPKVACQVALCAAYQAKATERIARSLESIHSVLSTLMTLYGAGLATQHPEALIAARDVQQQRCGVCQGTGIKTVGEAGAYCEWCQTGRDLRRMHRDAPGASA